MTFEKLLQQSLIWRGFYFITVLLVNVILSRFLQADGAGWIYYITNFFSLILLVASLSMESGYTFFSSNNTISKHKLAWFSIIWTVLVALLTLLLVGYYFFKIKHLSADISNQYILYSITYICGILLINFFTVLFYAQNNFFLPNLIMGILNLGLCVFIYFSATDINVYNKIVDAYFIVMLLQGILLALAFIVKNKSYTSFSLPNKNEVQQLLKYSLVALAGNLVFFFVYRIDYWFVRYNTNSCSAEDLGNYIQASKMGQLLLVIPQIMASAIFPQTASGAMRSNVNKSILVLFRIFLIVFIVAILLVAFLGNWLFPFVFGNSFNNVTIPLILLLPGIFGIAVLVLLSAYFSGKGKVSINVKGAALALIVVVIGDIIFIPKYGIYAAAFVSAIAYLVNLSYALWHFFKDYQLTFFQLFSFSKQDWFWVKNMLFNKK
ncbi:MAG: polysaccharide biosynthesis C-terminal domain-containing protein [Chitinophagaceae bacterium]